MNKNLSQSNDALQSIQNSSQNEIILYRPNDTISLEVRLENETVWLTQEQIALLFGVKRPAITKHVRNIFESEELEEKSVCSILERTASDGKHYMIQKHNAQYPPIKVNLYTKAHDRFLIIDDKVYHIGASVKDLGKKLCAVSLLSCIDADEMIGKL